MTPRGLRVDPRDAVPIWKQIEEGMRRLVASGALEPGRGGALGPRPRPRPAGEPRDRRPRLPAPRRRGPPRREARRGDVRRRLDPGAPEGRAEPGPRARGPSATRAPRSPSAPRGEEAAHALDAAFSRLAPGEGRREEVTDAATRAPAARARTSPSDTGATPPSTPSPSTSRRAPSSRSSGGTARGSRRSSAASSAGRSPRRPAASSSGRIRGRSRARLMERVGVVPEEPDAPREMTPAAARRLLRAPLPVVGREGLRRPPLALRRPARDLLRPALQGAEGAHAALPRPRGLARAPRSRRPDARPRPGRPPRLLRRDRHRAGRPRDDRVLTTHDLAGVERIADRVGILKDGRLLLCEETEALKTRFRAVRYRSEVTEGRTEFGNELDEMEPLRAKVRGWGIEAVVTGFTRRALRALRREGRHRRRRGLAPLPRGGLPRRGRRGEGSRPMKRFAAVALREITERRFVLAAAGRRRRPPVPRPAPAGSAGRPGRPHPRDHGAHPRLRLRPRREPPRRRLRRRPRARGEEAVVPLLAPARGARRLGREARRRPRARPPRRARSSSSPRPSRAGASRAFPGLASTPGSSGRSSSPPSPSSSSRGSARWLSGPAPPGSSSTSSSSSRFRRSCSSSAGGFLRYGGWVEPFRGSSTAIGVLLAALPRGDVRAGRRRPDRRAARPRCAVARPLGTPPRRRPPRAALWAERTIDPGVGRLVRAWAQPAGPDGDWAFVQGSRAQGRSRRYHSTF